MCKVLGPYRDGKGFRLKFKNLKTHKVEARAYFATEADAKSAIPGLLRKDQMIPGVTWAEALDSYRQYQQAKGNRPRTIETTLGRLSRIVFDSKAITGSVQGFERLWAAFMAKGPAVDTARNVFAQVRTLEKWLLSRDWIKAPFTTKTEVLGDDARARRSSPTMRHGALWLCAVMMPKRVTWEPLPYWWPSIWASETQRC